MYDYTFWQWLLFFFLYCFTGWVIESTIVSIETRHLTNRGFMRGPVIPIYGMGAIIILFACLPVRDNAFLVYLCGMLAATALEYFIGWLMEVTLKTKYWDYSKNKYNYKGRICATSSLFWGVLSLLLIDVLHKPVEVFVLGLPFRAVLIADLSVSVIFVADFVMSFKTAIDVNKVMARLDSIQQELAVRRAQLNGRVENNAALLEMQLRVEQLQAERRELQNRVRGQMKDFLRAFPTAQNSRFDSALKELKARAAARSTREIEEFKALYSDFGGLKR